MDTIISIVGFVLYVLCIYYNYRVANRLGWNKVVAVLVGAVIPFGGALIYNHYSYRGKPKTSDNKNF